MNPLERLEIFRSDHKRFHSYLQVRNFIIARSGGTPYGMYEQAIREIESRCHVLRSRYSTIALLEIDIEEFKTPQDAEYPSTEEKRDAIEQMNKRAELESARRALSDAEEEFAHFFNIACELKDQLGELTPELRIKLDREKWIHHLKSSYALAALTGQAPAKNVLEGIHSLDPQPREEVIESLRDLDGLVAWFRDSRPVLPDTPVQARLVSEDVRRFVNGANATEFLG